MKVMSCPKLISIINQMAYIELKTILEFQTIIKTVPDDDPTPLVGL